MYQIQSHPLLTSLFNQPYLDFVVIAMQGDNSPAVIWVDDPDAPRSAFIWDGTHSMYVGGDANNPAFNQWLNQLAIDTLLPAAERERLGIFKICAAQPAWDAQITAMFQPLTLQHAPRVIYRLSPVLIPAAPALPPEWTLKLIDRDLLADLARPGVSDLVGEIESCWTARDRFLERGFGLCLMSDTGEVVCWCTAEYVSPGVCGIGIETRKAYQGHGFATATARAFVDHAAQLGLQVHWDAWTRNVPSTRVAEKVGFEKLADYAVWVALFN